jgi:AbrB family looped-hinge helix DNA binding protein
MYNEEANMEPATVSAKGWVVIPARLRVKYAIKPGSRLRVVDYGGVLSLVPVSPASIEESRGMFKGKPSLTRALLEERRKERLRNGR